MIFDNQLRLAVQLINTYHYDEPLHLYLRKYFKANKKFGSKDRRLLTDLAYCYYRIGVKLEGLSQESQIIMAYYLLSEVRTPFIKHHKEKSSAFRELPGITEPMEVKLKALAFSSQDVFDFNAELSADIDKEIFSISLLSQPDVWVRVNKGQEQAFEEVLKENEVEFEKYPELTQAYRLPAKTKLDHIFNGKTVLFEVQDLSSQLIGNLFEGDSSTWWDCCAGAGGKSLLLMDKLPKSQLYVSDVRANILHNLSKRFKANRINNYRYAEINLATLTTDMIVFEPDKKYAHSGHFDNIIADVPCTGSGTWGRTPENLSSFKEKTIAEYQNKQKAIAGNAARFLKQGGVMYYITCSVFKAENEEVVEYLTEKYNLKVETQLTVKGYEHSCDSMFAAKLVKA